MANALQGSHLAGPDEVEFVPWDPEVALRRYRMNEVRFSAGYLRADPQALFPAFASHWIPLFHSIGVEVIVADVKSGLDFPEGLERIVPFQVDGEICVIGTSEETQRIMVDAISPGCAGTAAELVLEYIERRFIATLCKAWAKSQAPLQCSYLAPGVYDAVEISGNVGLMLEIGGLPVSVWLGLGPRILERLDLAWRADVVKNFSLLPLSGAHLSGDVGDSSLRSISLDLAELAVPPALLIDYIRSGAIICLERGITDLVSLKVDGSNWGVGTLGQFNGKFAVEMVDLNPITDPQPPSTARVRIELAELELDREGILEHSQPGAVLLTGTPVTSTCSLVISGENVASAVLGTIGGQMALSVLPK